MRIIALFFTLFVCHLDYCYGSVEGGHYIAVFRHDDTIDRFGRYRKDDSPPFWEMAGGY